MRVFLDVLTGYYGKKHCYGKRAAEGNFSWHASESFVIVNGTSTCSAAKLSQFLYILPPNDASSQLLQSWTTIPSTIRANRCRLFPDKAAVFSGGESLTFRQLHAEAAAAAQALASLGVSPGDRVGICMQKTLDQVVAILGCFGPTRSLFRSIPCFTPSRSDTWSTTAI